MGSELAYTCSHLLGDRLGTNDKQNNKTIITHNEAGPDRITSDTSDRLKMKEALQIYMDHLATGTDLLNVVTGLHVTNKVNADESIKIEREYYGRI